MDSNADKNTSGGTATSNIELTFQDFNLPDTTTSTSIRSPTSSHAINIPDAITFDDSSIPSSDFDQQPGINNNNNNNNNNAVGGSNNGQPTSGAAASPFAFWRIEYYQPYFNVDTNEVTMRVLRSMWPFKTSFVEYSRKNPDLYGPFWIVTSLILVMAVMSNLGSFFNYQNIVYKNGHATNNGTDIVDRAIEDLIDPWAYDFKKVTVGASVMYTYASIIPILLWLTMRYKQVPVSMVETICLYGYSFSVLIPTSVLCVLPFSVVRWIAIAAAFLMSGWFITSNLFPVWKQSASPDGKKFIPVFLGYVVILHVALACIFKFYFFHFSHY